MSIIKGTVVGSNDEKLIADACQKYGVRYELPTKSSQLMSDREQVEALKKKAATEQKP